MQKSHKRNAALLAVVLLAGCNAHPIPDDVTLDTVAVVQKIRCEARDAVLDAMISKINERGTESDKRYAADLSSDRTRILRKDRAQLSEDMKSYLRTYAEGAIGYNFSFDITVNTDNSVGINLFNPFSNGTRTFDIGAGVARQNQGTRSFQIVDTFTELAKLYETKDGKDSCFRLAAGNALYPITGTIGLKEVVRTFINLNDIAGIERKAEGDKTTTFSDAIEFQTTISGRVNPKIELSPVKHGVGLADAGMTNTWKRTDKHKVIIALQLKPQQAVTAGAKKPVTIKPAAGVLRTIDRKLYLDREYQHGLQ